MGPKLTASLSHPTFVQVRCTSAPQDCTVRQAIATQGKATTATCAQTKAAAATTQPHASAAAAAAVAQPQAPAAAVAATVTDQFEGPADAAAAAATAQPHVAAAPIGQPKTAAVPTCAHKPSKWPVWGRRFQL